MSRGRIAWFGPAHRNNLGFKERTVCCSHALSLIDWAFPQEEINKTYGVPVSADAEAKPLFRFSFAPS